MVKQIIIYVGSFAVLLVLMTFIVYQMRIGDIEDIREKNVAADSLALADSLQADSTGIDSLQLRDSISTVQADSFPGDQALEELEQFSNDGVIPEESEPEEIKEYKNVAKIYEKMKPDQAARILNGLTDEEKARILMVMKDRQSAKILALMDPANASKISQLIMKYKK